MLRLTGAVLIVAACSLWGLTGAGELRRRAALLRGLVSALGQLRAEIVTRLSPLPDAAERLANAGPEETRVFFAELCASFPELGRRGFRELWADCALCLGLRKAELSELTALGAVLGRSCALEQDRALSAAAEFFTGAAEEAAREAKNGGRLLPGLGLTVGLLLAVTLI